MSAKHSFVRGGPATKTKPAAAPQARFIPREALGAFSTWQPRTIEGPTDATHQTLAPTALQRATAQALAAAAGSTAAVSTTTAAALTTARQAGYQDGYRDGVAALENFKQSYASQITAQVGALLVAFDAQLCALDTHIAQALAHSATQLARELLRSELQTRPELVAQVAEQAVAALLPAARQIRIHAHPQDLPLIAQGAQDALAARHAQLVADATLARGGVRVESDLAHVDARISTRWQQAAASLGSTLPWVEEAALARPTASGVAA